MLILKPRSCGKTLQVIENKQNKTFSNVRYAFLYVDMKYFMWHNPAMAKKQSISTRFQKHVLRREDGCWEWTSQRNQAGYGQIREGTGAISAHRVSWEMVNGPIADGMCILHRCDRPWCVNPDHLYLGTHKENTRDMDARGRRVKAGTYCGPKSRVYKLTDDQVRAIRRDDRHYVVIAVAYGIGVTTAYDIKRRKTKTLVPD